MNGFHERLITDTVGAAEVFVREEISFIIKHVEIITPYFIFNSTRLCKSNLEMLKSNRQMQCITTLMHSSEFYLFILFRNFKKFVASSNVSS